jgi:serine phosphatase RsbU (regulator of sigma subunit)
MRNQKKQFPSNISTYETAAVSTTIDTGYELISNMKLNEAIDLASTVLNSIAKESYQQVPFLILLGEAYVYADQLTLASDAFFDALTFLKIKPDSSLEAQTLIGLSAISRFIGDYPQAISYANQALELETSLTEIKLKALLSNGISKGKLQDFHSAQVDLEKAIAFSKELKSAYYEASSLKALGELLHYRKNFTEAETHLKEAINLASTLGHHLLISLIHISIGKLVMEMNQNPVNNFVLAVAAAKKEDFITAQAISYEALSSYYGKVNNKELAYENLRKSIDLTKQTEAEKKRDFYKRQLKHISELKQKEIELLKEISVRHQEIKDSIDYAQHIQTGLLPSNRYLVEKLKSVFTIHEPKDVIGGDFYWIAPILDEHQILFAVADCTGHGVPGALMSIVCNHALNRATREFGLRDPGEILDKTRFLVVEEFEDSIRKSSPTTDNTPLENHPVLDGMDIALCSLTVSSHPINSGEIKRELKYAGAHNPLWIIRNGELIEIKSDKQPIGQFDHATNFTTHTLELQKEDMIYIFTDGYADQFGGEKGKKLKTKAFKNLLLEINSEEVSKQKERLSKNFLDWKGDLEQVDDVCILGVRI